MVRKSIATAAALGSAALAVAGLGSTTSSAAGPSGAATSANSVATVSASAPLITWSRHNGHKVASFALVRSAASVQANCLANARATVSIEQTEQVEFMRVHAEGLPKNTGFDFFVTQVPNAPFGLSWYQGDLESNQYGKASVTYVGRFNEETFSVAPGVAPAPVKHTSPIADANQNPATAPVHQYHLGFWFNSPADAAKAGCNNVVTPFNGEHNAGPQAMSTRQFPALAGPLSQIKP
jgi:hypothetical protein